MLPTMAKKWVALVVDSLVALATAICAEVIIEDIGSDQLARIIGQLIMMCLMF